jgi:hypothetical protein
LCFIFFHISIFCLHCANPIHIYISHLHYINMALISCPHYNRITFGCFVVHIHYNHIAFAWHLVVHCACICCFCIANSLAILLPFFTLFCFFVFWYLLETIWLFH